MTTKPTLKTYLDDWTALIRSKGKGKAPATQDDIPTVAEGTAAEESRTEEDTMDVSDHPNTTTKTTSSNDHNDATRKKQKSTHVAATGPPDPCSSSSNTAPDTTLIATRSTTTNDSTQAVPNNRS